MVVLMGHHLEKITDAIAYHLEREYTRPRLSARRAGKMTERGWESIKREWNLRYGESLVIRFLADCADVR